MSGIKYKKLKRKLKKIKNYKVDDNKLAVLVFIVTVVLGARIGNYLRLFIFNFKEKDKYPILKNTELIEEYREDESKWPDDRRTGIGARSVSLFGKRKRINKVALASLLGGGLGIGTGFYLRDKWYRNKYKNKRKFQEKRKEIVQKVDDDFKNIHTKLKKEKLLQI